MGPLVTPVRIYDISSGGCFINAMHDQAPGVAFVLEIDLPEGATISVSAETLYAKVEFGYAVRFVEMSADARARLHQFIDDNKDQRL